MTPEQREDLQWLAVLDTLDPKAVGLRHAESIRAALAEIDSLKARIDKLLLAGLQAEAKLATTLQDRVECVECHALIPSGGEWPSSPHPESSSLCWGCGPGTHRIKELETSLTVACVEAGGTRDHHPALCSQQIVGTIETLKRAVKEHADHMDVCLEATYKGERDHVRRLLDMKDHDYALINYDLRKAEARINALEQSGQAAGAIICQQRDRIAAVVTEVANLSNQLGRRQLWVYEMSFLYGFTEGVHQAFDLLGERRDERVKVLRDKAQAEMKDSMHRYDAALTERYRAAEGKP